ncbi:MAG: 1-deoxy-D-xylulose-5-phosphate reductoisomerase [bacterium]
MKKIIILGCTGSIGTQTLDIIDMFPDRFQVTGISARGTHPDRLESIIRRFRPEAVVVDDAACAKRLENLPGIKNFGLGQHALQALAGGQMCEVDLVVSAQSGTSGIIPTVAAIEAGIDVALANKETLVTGGEWVMALHKRSGSRIIPVDSEHSAIYQCLQSLDREDIDRLVLTCSGGPFSAQPELDLNTITPKHALAHPTWNMGGKITIDSATLMNKGLEIIEARWLFDIPQKRIDVVIHPQSIIHSLVETLDGSMLAQLSIPDMRHPILYALTGGRHPKADLPKLNLASVGSLTFAKPDTERFPCLNLARYALREGGTMPAVLNTADEIAVNAFRDGKIAFTDIPRVIAFAMEKHSTRPLNGIEVIGAVDAWTKEVIRAGWNL